MNSLSEENYLKTIYHLSKQSGNKVSVKAISEHLGINPASVIDMLKKLTDKKLIQYDKTKGAKLNDKGLKTALLIVRKHRLWEVFLKEKLNYSWDEVHDIAEQMEHIKHSDLADRLDKFLGYPEYDPHGDPIPKPDGRLPAISRITLAEAETGKNCVVVGVKDTSTLFLQYLKKLNVEIGTKIKITERVPFDGSASIIIGKSEKATISKQFAENVMVSRNAS